MSRFPPPDLFGDRPSRRDEVERSDLVDLVMHLHHISEKAWLLSKDGESSAAAWLPFSQGQRGEGRDEYLFTMPRWIARDRGWL